MPLDLQDDIVLWLKNQGMPVNTKNLNIASAHLSENPQDRPSYKEGSVEEGSELERMLMEQTREPTSEAPASAASTYGTGRTSSSSSSLPPSKPSIPDEEVEDVSPSSPVDESIDRTMDSPEMKESEGLSVGEGAMMAGAGVAGAASLMAQMKKAMEQAGNDDYARKMFINNMKKRFETYEAGGKKSISMADLDAFDRLTSAAQVGDGQAFGRAMGELGPDAKKSIQSLLSNPIPAATRPSPRAGRAGNAGMELLKTLMTRGR